MRAQSEEPKISLQALKDSGLMLREINSRLYAVVKIRRIVPGRIRGIERRREFVNRGPVEDFSRRVFGCSMDCVALPMEERHPIYMPGVVKRAAITQSETMLGNRKSDDKWTRDQQES